MERMTQISMRRLGWLDKSVVTGSRADFPNYQ
jgi:hypothetical protein